MNMPMDLRSSNFLTKDDVSDFTSSQRSDVNTVPLAEILEYKRA